MHKSMRCGRPEADNFIVEKSEMKEKRKRKVYIDAIERGFEVEQ